MNHRTAIGLAILCLCLLVPAVARADAIVFSSAAAINVPILGVADPYPATMNVSGISGAVTGFTLTLSSVSHGFVDDMSVAIVSPQGTAVLLFSGAGPNFTNRGPWNITNQTWTFDDNATATLPRITLPTSGTYRPGLFEYDDTFPARPGLASYGSPLNPLPNVLLYGFSFAPFLAEDLNGQWQLLVMDLNDENGGSIAGGWSMTINFDPTAVPEPSTMIMLAVAGCASGASRLWRRRSGK